MMARPGSLAWFAHHELRLAWRDWLGMVTGGRRGRKLGLFVAGLALYALLHAIAASIVAPAARSITIDKPTLVMVTGMGLLFFSVMLSQALEAIARVYYARSDLDLILSSPASAPKLFAVRTGAVALSTALLSALLSSPLVNVLTVLSGPHWLWAYLLLPAFAAISVALAMALTIGLFRLVGAKRTRLIAQILAAIIGAGFVIGIQAVAILPFDSYSRFDLLGSPDVVAALSDASSWIWLPARAIMGDAASALTVVVIGLGIFVITLMLASPSYGRLAVAAASVGHASRQRHRTSALFAGHSATKALRRKEWRLLQRDPWLLSQTLMQMFYLVPPALLLWVNYGAGAGSFIVIVPVLVMAAGQLAGGLAWLALSGEDAFDLVATAPIPSHTILRAKVEAVLVVVAVILLPLLALLALNSWPMALATGVCATFSAAAATAIQVWFRVPMRRVMFRRRQVASRAATIAEAFSSITWAGTGALSAVGSWTAAIAAIVAVIVLGIARSVSPHRR